MVWWGERHPFRVFQVRASQVHIGQVRASQVHIGQVRASQVHVGQVHTRQVRAQRGTPAHHHRSAPNREHNHSHQKKWGTLDRIARYR